MLGGATAIVQERAETEVHENCSGIFSPSVTEKAASSDTGMTWFLSQSDPAFVCKRKRERKQGGRADNNGAGVGS